MTTSDGRGREAERMRLLHVAVPLLAAGVVGVVLYVWLAIAFSAPVLLLAVPLCGSGVLATSRAVRDRMRAAAGPETLQHVSWLLAGLVLTLAGLVIPIFLT